MHEFTVKCPGCQFEIISSSGIDIKDIERVEGRACTNCGLVICKADLIQQARNYSEIILKDMLGKALY
ncbi:ECs_2282 family putative zinc-binding protein [Klebsiella sp. WOUb02]|uniref:ECs_2282 family putative zinc-binding protein n=1 Tax=Klebsiella sp. WOUb02 TaxID=3161071 RepID=UPI003CF48412